MDLFSIHIPGGKQHGGGHWSSTCVIAQLTGARQSLCLCVA